ncbi:TniQ family protein [Pseudomonadota bacterium]
MSNSREHYEELWPYRPRPIQDESFSSWFCRIAWANGLSAAELYAVAFPGARMFRLDLDRFAGDALIENLSAHTGIPPSDLRSRTFRHWAERVFEHDDGQVKLAWLPPAGLFRSSKSFGQQICPQCLRETDTTYLKKTWRLSFVSACDLHRTLLIDRCPACAAPIQPLYASPSDLAMSLCWNCGFDLRYVLTDRVVDLTAQTALLKIAHDGWSEMGDYGDVHAVSFFCILRKIYRLLATGRFALPLREWVGDKEPPAGIPRIKEIERLNPRCRHALVNMAANLIRDWPHRFIQACREVGISTRVLLKDPTHMPFALWEPVSLQLSNPVFKATQADIKSAKTYLCAHGQRPTYRALMDLLGLHFHAHRNLALPANKHAPYGTCRYWKLDGVSPKVRAAAKQAARREGESVGGWVDKALRRALKPFEEKA